MTAINPISVVVEFKDIPGSPGYRAASDGPIWSCWRFHGAGYGGRCKQVMSDRWRKLKGDPRKQDGRLRYTIRRADGSYRRAYGSHLVLEAFIGPCPPGLEACHGDGNCLNDAIVNLRWDTSVSNKADMLVHGTRRRGESLPKAKLTEDAVRDIRRTGYPLKPLAEKYGVSLALISMVLKGKIWTHVELPPAGPGSQS